MLSAVASRVLLLRAAAAAAAPVGVVARRAASTQALVLEKPHKLSMREINVDEPFTADDVRIDIQHVGICGSDVHYYEVMQPRPRDHAHVTTPTHRSVVNEYKSFKSEPFLLPPLSLFLSPLALMFRLIASPMTIRNRMREMKMDREWSTWKTDDSSSHPWIVFRRPFSLLSLSVSFPLGSVTVN